MQNITKHHHLLCSVKVSHFRKHTFWHLWVSKSSTKYQPEVGPSEIHKKTYICNKNGSPTFSWKEAFFLATCGHSWPFGHLGTNNTSRMKPKASKMSPSSFKMYLQNNKNSTCVIKVHPSQQCPLSPLNFLSSTRNNTKCAHNKTRKPCHLAGQAECAWRLE